MNCRPVTEEEVARSRKFALNRETLRTTGTGKPGIIFRQREFATIPSPPLHRTVSKNNTEGPQYAFS
jgi:hypothetical protein